MALLARAQSRTAQSDAQLQEHGALLASDFIGFQKTIFRLCRNSEPFALQKKFTPQAHEFGRMHTLTTMLRTSDSSPYRITGLIKLTEPGKPLSKIAQKLSIADLPTGLLTPLERMA